MRIRPPRIFAAGACLLVAAIVAIGPLTAHGSTARATAPPARDSALSTIAVDGGVSVTPWDEPSSTNGSDRLLTYRMPASRGGQTRASALLLVPHGHPPAGGWPVIAWAHGTTTPGGADCAPSLTPDELDGGLTRDGFASNYGWEVRHFVNAGYAVVAPDLEGLGPEATVPYPYFDAASGARSLITSVEAARKVDPALSRRYAVVGHSDGAHLVLGVEAHAAQAPQLSLLGTVAIAPYTSIQALTTDLARMGRTGTGVVGRGGTAEAQFEVALMAVGIEAVDPRWNPATVMGPDLEKLLPAFKTLCSVPAIALIDKAVAKAHGAFRGYKPDWAQNPTMKAFLATNDPPAEPGFDLRRPTLIEQGTADTFVLRSLTSTLVAELRREGAPVTYHTYPGDSHFSVIKSSEPDVLSFLHRLFR